MNTLHPHMQGIAAAYEALPQSLGALPAAERSTIVGAWRELAEDSLERAAGIRLLLHVRETDDAEPYPDAETMCADIARGRFVVSRANSAHPLWSPDENVAFRVVHDVLGHYAATLGAIAQQGIEHWARAIVGEWDDDAYADSVAGFDWAGELAACGAHAPLLPSQDARAALFSECVAQTGFAIARGGFGPQKVGILRRYLDGRARKAYDRFVDSTH